MTELYWVRNTRAQPPEVTGRRDKVEFLPLEAGRSIYMRQYSKVVRDSVSGSLECIFSFSRRTGHYTDGVHECSISF